MLNDLYTYIIGYVTPRTNGCAGGDFLVAGPDWAGARPPGIKRVFHAPTQIALAFFRTQLFGPDDHREGLGDSGSIPGAAPVVLSAARPRRILRRHSTGSTPLDVRKEPTSLQFFAILNWMLQYMPALAEERDLRERLATIGVKPAPSFEVRDEATRAALVQGMQAGLQTMQAAFGQSAIVGRVVRQPRIPRQQLHEPRRRRDGRHPRQLRRRISGHRLSGDADGQPFDGSHAYRIKFKPGDMPPVKAFWSITVYNAAMLLYANPLNRYVINSPMLDELVRDADGGFTLYVQHESPGPDKEPNWLPVPQGRFNLTFRAYQPEQAILDFTYRAPPVVVVA